MLHFRKRKGWLLVPTTSASFTPPNNIRISGAQKIVCQRFYESGVKLICRVPNGAYLVVNASWMCVWLWDLKEWLLTCTSIVAPSLCNMSEHPRHFCGRWLLGGNSDIWELSASMSIHISWVATTMNWSGFQSKEILSSVKGNLVLLPTKSIKTFFVIQITILMMYVVCKCSILPSRMGEHGEHRKHRKMENPKRMLLEERCMDPHNLQ